MIYIASDHAGFELKENIKLFLMQEEIAFEDIGPKTMDPNDDYPDYAFKLAKKIIAEKTHESRGILICGGANGICMAANKMHSLRAGVGYNLAAAESMRKDNDANVICLAGRVLQQDFARAIVRKFLETKFSGEERHVRRIKKIAELDANIKK